MKRDEFEIALKELGINTNPEMLEKYYTYAALLKEWNEKMNLTAIVEEEEVLQMHFYDSILPFAHSKLTTGTLVDVGAGAGFPSIPCLIAFPDLKVTICEPLGKRCVFLNEVKKVLGLDNLEIVNARAEDFAAERRESYDLVSARAVANLNILCELCLPLVKVNGHFVAMKGSSGMSEHEGASKALKTLGAKFINSYEEHVGEHTHINLIYEKVEKTPAKYPRPYAKIKKQPL